MFKYDIYANDNLICTISINNVIQALKKVENHHLVCDVINKQKNQGKPIQLFAINQLHPDDWISFVYSPKKQNLLQDNECTNKDEITRGFVYLETEIGISRKCLSLRKGRYCAYFDGAESEFVITNTETHFDTDGFQDYINQFPIHFDSVYYNVIFEILEDNLSQHLKKLDNTVT